MYIYLPIAEMPMNIFALLLLGGVTGILAGMFGIGGGFLMTPFLMFMGVPPAVAVSSSANQIIASSFSGFLAHWRRRNVDLQMSQFLLIGGVLGALIGVSVFAQLKRLGHLDITIALCYVLFLGTLGTLMARESLQTIYQKRREPMQPMPTTRVWFHLPSLPFQIHFTRSDVTISALLPITIGVVVGLLVSLMGIGGGFVMIPAMIYILGMPTAVVIGTSLLEIVCITALVTFLQAVQTHTVDVVLAALMIVSSVIGAQYGTKLGQKIPPEKLRAVLAGMVLLVVLRLAYGLIVTPENPFTIDLWRQ